MSQPSRPASAKAVHRKPPSQLRELVRLELKKRQLIRELAGVCDEMDQVRHEIRILGIEIPWQVPRSNNPVRIEPLSCSNY
jgi:hypothetical protein